MLAEELHFGRAAARLRMAQPPLSRLIRQLEAELDAELFERSTRHVTLSAQGAALVEPARELVMQSRRMKEIVRQAKAGETGRLHLGFSGASVHHLVSRLTRAIRADRPGLTVDLWSAQLSQPGLERVLDGSLDAVIGRWDFLPDGVESRVLAREDLLVALPRDHRLARHREIEARDLADEPWIVLPGGSGATLSYRLHLLGMQGGFVPRIVRTAPDSATELLLVDAAVGVALTLSGVRENLPAGDVEFRRVKPDLGPVEVRLVWRDDRMSPALVAAIEIAATVFGAR